MACGPFFKGSGAIGMHFNRGAIQAHVLAAEGENLLLLQPREDPIQHSRFTPAIHTRVDRMPVAKLFGQAPPFAAMLHHVKHGIEQLQIGHAHVPALPHQAIGKPLILILGQLHPHQHASSPAEYKLSDNRP